MSFITNELLEDIAVKSNLYAKQEKKVEAFKFSKGELLRFLRVASLFGYHSLPSEQYLWSNQPDLGVSIVAEAMSNKRFLKIKGMFHLADNEKLIVKEGKVAEVALLYSSLNDTFVRYGIFHSIDELIIPYFGRHNYKMFRRGKPIRFGYKIRCLCDSDGYPYHLISTLANHRTPTNRWDHLL